LPIKNVAWVFQSTKTAKEMKITKGLKNITDEENDYFETILKISKVTKYNKGSYTCNISNTLDSVKKEIDLTFHSAPRDIEIIPTGRTLEGNIMVVNDFVDISLECIALKAYPIPKITWYKNGNKIGHGIIYLKKKDIGHYDGSYNCTAYNNIGSFSKHFELKVKIPPITKRENMQTVYAELNQKIELNCDFDGYPKPEITWIFNSKSIESTDSLLKLYTDRQAFGIYECEGKNKFGKDSIKFSVELRGN
jgi:hypothetical protein